MPIKDQTLCYRTIKGVKWLNLCDMLEQIHQDDVAAIKRAGGRIALRRHPDGYQQAFFHPDDDELVTKICQQDALNEQSDQDNG